jgi:hypothetical protein
MVVSFGGLEKTGLFGGLRLEARAIQIYIVFGAQ